MSVDTMARLFELKNILGVKDATGNLDRVDQQSLLVLSSNYVPNSIVIDWEVFSLYASSPVHKIQSNGFPKLLIFIVFIIIPNISTIGQAVFFRFLFATL